MPLACLQSLPFEHGLAARVRADGLMQRTFVSLRHIAGQDAGPSEYQFVCVFDRGGELGDCAVVGEQLE